MVDESNNNVVSYTYSPYGEIVTATGSMAEINPLCYRGYYYDSETGFYYLQSRYYDPVTGRFISPDSYISTGQGLLGFNMYAYCNNNPVSYSDRNGQDYTEAIPGWLAGFSWLPLVDGAIPIGDLIYLGVVIVAVLIASNEDDTTPQISYSDAYVGGSPPSPNNDDDDDDYNDYDDESNYGGRQKIGKSHGKTPRSNQSQNKQFESATQGLSEAQKKIVHRNISGKGYGYHEIRNIAKELFPHMFTYSYSLD